MEKRGVIKYFGEGCVKWFINEMVEIKTYTKVSFENDIELNPDTIGDHDETKCYLSEKDFKSSKTLFEMKQNRGPTQSLQKTENFQ